MLKPRNPIIATLLSLIAASACHRLPLSIGEGIDDTWHDPDGSGSAGSGSAGSGSAGTGAGGATGGAAGLDECDATYLSCIESGLQESLCGPIFDQCAGGTAGAGMSFAGTAGTTGSPGASPGGTAVAGAGGYPSGGEPATGGASSSGTGVAGTAGSASGGAYPDGTGAAGTGGYPAAGEPANGGSAGSSGIDECNTTYALCLESGEQPEVCRDELIRCELFETGSGGAAGTSGQAGTANAANY